jgi:CheY-like chemotaxis protein
MKKGPVILIDDDKDDCEIVREALQETGCGNEVIAFADPQEAFDALHIIIKKQTPFLIFCDINLPSMNGIELKQKIDNDKELRSKSIPFIFLSTAGEQKLVKKAYECCTVQGFFMKETKMSTLIRNLRTILDYWSIAQTPD